jgi:pimeloyl-ACP methyl ester carboxylesterase
MRSLGPAAALACLVACAASHAPRAPAPSSPPGIALLPCAVRGLGRPSFCGVASVPEDRVTRRGRVVDLDVVVIPASDADGARPDPVFVLAGGPGQAATDAAADVAETFAAALTKRDFVLLDQRGTGRHSPLRCRLAADDAELGTLAGGALPEDRLRACLDRLDARPELYTTSIAADDLDEVAARMGYERVNLLAGSYGTAVAQEMMRRHPGRVRTAVLDGVVPLDVDFVEAFAPNAQRVLDEVVAECARDEACHGAFPDPRGDLDRAVARLQAAPVRVAARSHGDRTAAATLDVGALAMSVRKLLYSDATRGFVPAVLHAAASGDDRAIAPLVVRTAEAMARDLSVGAYLSVTCAEDLAGVTPAQAEEVAAGTFLGTARVGPTLRACAFWPLGAVEPGFHSPVRSDVPVLLLSGTMDPATPVEWADRVAAVFPRARKLVVPGGGHGVSDSGCVPQVISRFLDAPASQLDASCIVPVPTKFALSLPGE